ncbi:DUF488 family protein [Kitasatospora phosalacinea]|uniref:HTH cro/C1-type domain-containing protein n=1 Tax=Kitasatospora phosalacinea TaxID=2065 RepID=A0A9W6PFL0_9ACTN|nr:DUF488 family protein [Kitasatospora phosalacinea]GLW55115.1 hypothetical protein Kpho01_31260 [Kitasatospora phosalacinea]
MSGRRYADGSERAHCLGRWLRALREARGLTRPALARAAGVPLLTLSRPESAGVAQPGLFTVMALARVMEVTVDELVAAADPVPGLWWSTGYEGRTIDSFVTALVGAGVDAVADVRLTPISRKPGFSKSRLSAALAEADISYLHLRSPGNPKDNRVPFWDGRVGEGLAVFADVPASEPARRELAELAVGRSVAVLCFEQDESRCHRQAVLAELHQRTALPVAALA